MDMDISIMDNYGFVFGWILSIHNWIFVIPTCIHHRLIVPYAIGALYNHPLEGLLLDTLGGALSFLVSGMTARTAVIFFCFAVIKIALIACQYLPLVLPKQHRLSRYPPSTSGLETSWNSHALPSSQAT
ncbi:hypothetical protein CUMW_021400 [Citrus unshiu]|nr:hypothetical protein CUMW_021400 [Citrus unshiu]